MINNAEIVNEILLAMRESHHSMHALGDISKPCMGMLSGFNCSGQPVYILAITKPYKPLRFQCEFLLDALNFGHMAGVAFTLEQALRIAENDYAEQTAQVKYLNKILNLWKKIEPEK